MVISVERGLKYLASIFAVLSNKFMELRMIPKTLCSMLELWLNLPQMSRIFLYVLVIDVDGIFRVLKVRAFLLANENLLKKQKERYMSIGKYD